MSGQRPRLVVVGAGHLGQFHLAKLAAMGPGVLVGVVDTCAARRDAAAATFGVPGASRCDAFAGACDAAIVATPTASHAAVAGAALALGWDLLVEKPLAHSAAAAAALVAQAAAGGRILQVGHVERFNPAVVAALAAIGRPRYVVAERLGPFTGRSGEVHVVLDLMIHDLDIVAAAVAQPVVEVRAIGVPVLTDAVDMCSARLAFADGSVAQLSAGRASLTPSRRLRLFGEAGYVSVDCAAREVKMVRRLTADDGGAQIAGGTVDVAAGDALALQDADFVACVAARRAPRVDGAAGLLALQLAEAIMETMTAPSRSPPPTFPSAGATLH